VPNINRPNRLLAALNVEQFGTLEPHLEEVDLPVGRLVYEHGETIDYAYFPCDSIVSITAAMKRGGSTPEMVTIGREGILGLVPLLGDRQAFGRYVVQVPGSALRIDHRHLDAAWRAHPAIRTTFLRYLQALLAQAFQSVACNAIHSVEARCCRWILMTHDRARQDDLSLTHEFLAAMLGVHRPTVTIVTPALQTAGLIAQRRKSILIVDRPGLEQASCECYGHIRGKFESLLPKTYSD
jgi:CRP-like cAMP-binding protein